MIYVTFLFGCHYFYPTIYLQISPSFTLGCHIKDLNLIIGNLKGNCSGKSKSTIRSNPSYGDPTGPFIITSQWNKFSLCRAVMKLYKKLKYSGFILMTAASYFSSLFIQIKKLINEYVYTLTQKTKNRRINYEYCLIKPLESYADFTKRKNCQ